MSATDYPPRCKDKKNLANDVYCEPKILFFYLSLHYSHPLARDSKFAKVVNFLDYWELLI